MSDPLVAKYFKSFDADPLSKKEEGQLFRRWKNKKDKKALDKLITANLKFVVKQANKFIRYADGKSITISDLIQAGNEGMLVAVERFKPSKKVKFITYATHWINAYIRNFIYSNVSVVRVALNNKTKSLIDQKWNAVNLLNGKNSEELEKWRTEFRNKFGISENTMANEEQKIQTIFQHFSMDKKTNNYENEEGGNFHNQLSNEQFNTEYLVENKQRQDLIKKKIKNAMRSLSPYHRDIVRMRFLKDDSRLGTMREIGEKHNISRQRIEQIQKKSFEKMKAKLSMDPTIREILSC